MRLLAAALVAILLVAGPVAAGVADRTKLWRSGAKLTVCFFNGSQVFKRSVVEVASTWSEHANLTFDFGNGPDFRTCSTAIPSDIRVRASDGEANSYVGTDAKTVPLTQPTVTLWNRIGQDPSNAWSRTILHEFGHVLGFSHESQHPDSPCYADLDRQKFADPPLNWPNQLIDLTFKPYAPSPNLLTTAFDPTSVMVFSVPASFFKQLSRFCSPQPTGGLSDGDKLLAAAAYPKDGNQNVDSARSVPISSVRRGYFIVDLERSLNLSRELAGVSAWEAFGISSDSVSLAGLSDPRIAPMVIGASRYFLESVKAKASGAMAAAVTAHAERRYPDVLPQVANDDYKSPIGHLLLANMRLEGLGDPPDVDNALTWARAAADARSPQGRALLGLFQQFGIGLPAPDVAQAVEAYEAAANLEPAAAHLLGLIHLSDLTKRDYEKARRYFEEAASAGFAPSNGALATVYYLGLGVARDLGQALQFARRGADKDSVGALTVLALILADDRGPDFDVAAAVATLHRSVRGGSPFGEAVLARAYETGALGLQQDHKEAARHYRGATIAGVGAFWFRFAESMLQSAEQNSGVQSTEAIWRAANLGYVTAQLRLANLYLNGFGQSGPAATASPPPASPIGIAYPVQKDAALAFSWYTIAALYGDETEKKEAEQAIDKLTPSLDRASWVKAQELAIAVVRAREKLARAEQASTPDNHLAGLSALSLVPVSAGTGVIVNRRGIVVTNNHVVAGCQRIRTTVGGSSNYARPVKDNAAYDLAILRMDYQPGISSRLRSEPVRKTDKLLVIGYPRPDVLGSQTPKHSPGAVTALTGQLETELSQFQMSATVNPGNSGGPIFDEQGRLVGIVVARTPAAIAQNINIAIKGTVLREFLDGHDPEMATEAVEKPTSVSDNEKTVVFIECLKPKSSLAAK